MSTNFIYSLSKIITEPLPQLPETTLVTEVSQDHFPGVFSQMEKARQVKEEL